VYGAALWFCGTDPRHIPDSGMHGVTFASYNLALGGIMAWGCDW